MPIRGMEMRAVTGLGGATAATAAAAFRWAASDGWGGDVAVGAAGDVVEVIARAVRDAPTRWAGERPSPAAGMLASRTRTPAASRTSGPRLMDLCSHPSGESQSIGARGTTLRRGLGFRFCRFRGRLLRRRRRGLGGTLSRGRTLGGGLSGGWGKLRQRA